MHARENLPAIDCLIRQPVAVEELAEQYAQARASARTGEKPPPRARDRGIEYTPGQLSQAALERGAKAHPKLRRQDLIDRFVLLGEWYERRERELPPPALHGRDRRKWR